MSFICRKALTLGGTKYYPGDTIPDNAVVPVRVMKLEKSGYISSVSDGDADGQQPDYIAEGIAVEDYIKGFEGKVSIPVIRDGDDDTAELMNVPLTEGEVQLVFATMQMTVPKAEEQIEQIDSEEVLIVLHASDSRQGVKKAARKRADTLLSTKQEKDAPSGYNESSEEGNGTDTTAE